MTGIDGHANDATASGLVRRQQQSNGHNSGPDLVDDNFGALGDVRASDVIKIRIEALVERVTPAFAQPSQNEVADGCLIGRREVTHAPDTTDVVATARFIVGDPDTVGEQLAADLALGVDALPQRAHQRARPGRVALLGQVASKVVGSPR